MSSLRNTQEQMIQDILRCAENVEYLKYAERLNVYTEGYEVRMLENLMQNFFITQWVLGEERFVQLMRDYIQAYPSQEYNITRIGKNMVEFIQKNPIPKYPFLADLTRYEWILAVRYEKKQLPPADVSSYQSIAPNAWEQARFVFQPHLTIDQFHWTVFALHQALLNDKKFAPHMIRQEENYFFFYQKGNGGVSTVIEKAEYDVLGLLLKGASLGEVCESIANEEMMDSIFTWFRKWQELDLIAEIKI